MDDLTQCPHTHPNSLGAGRCDRRFHARGRHRAQLTRTTRVTWAPSRDHENFAPDPMTPDRWALCCTKGNPCPDHAETV